jgi:hypothetical protein
MFPRLSSQPLLLLLVLIMSTACALALVQMLQLSLLLHHHLRHRFLPLLFMCAVLAVDSDLSRHFPLLQNLILPWRSFLHLIKKLSLLLVPASEPGIDQTLSARQIVSGILSDCESDCDSVILCIVFLIWIFFFPYHFVPDSVTVLPHGFKKIFSGSHHVLL